jgi:uncharacterized membrane protein
MRKLLIPAIALLPLAAGGCVKTVYTVATAPVKVVSKTVDWTTTSQSEADRNAGRKLRKQQEREGREARKAKKQQAQEQRQESQQPQQ